MKINFRSKYLDYGYIINNIVKPNNKLDIYFFHFFKNNQLLYTKKMIYNYNNFNYYRISKSVLNSFYEKKYKISYVHYVILLTDIYVNGNQQLIYINTYNDNSFRNFIIGSYYKFCSREYIEYNHQHIYYTRIDDWIGDFYYFNYYITKKEVNDMRNQLKTYSKSIELLYIL